MNERTISYFRNIIGEMPLGVCLDIIEAQHEHAKATMHHGNPSPELIADREDLVKTYEKGVLHLRNAIEDVGGNFQLCNIPDYREDVAVDLLFSALGLREAQLRWRAKERQRHPEAAQG